MCIIALKSMTHAIKAKKALNDYFVSAEIIKLEPSMTKKGCAYGVEFNCYNLVQVQEILRMRGVRYTELIEVMGKL